MGCLWGSFDADSVLGVNVCGITASQSVEAAQLSTSFGVIGWAVGVYYVIMSGYEQHTIQVLLHCADDGAVLSSRLADASAAIVVHRLPRSVLAHIHAMVGLWPATACSRLL